MLHIQISPQSGVPVYRQVMEQIRYYVASGALKPGDQLPSIRELAQTLTINPATAVKAYSELEHEGIVDMKHGKGAFVAAGAVRMTAPEREAALRQLARQLAVAAAQMQTPVEHVIDIVRAEMGALESHQASPSSARPRQAREGAS